MSQWVRLWEDMPNDPKWRVVARRCGRPVSEVLAVFIHMMTNAGSSADRGSLERWSDEDVAIAIDSEPEHVAAIREAMQGKTLEDDHLTGWEKRQPKREDNSTDRVREHRERAKASVERNETRCNADETTRNAPEEKRGDTETEEKDSNCSLCSQSSPQADGGSADDLFDDGVIDLEVRKKTDQDLLRWFGESWNDLADDLGLSQVRELTKARQSNIRQRAADLVKIYDFSDPKTGFANVFARIRGSPFLRGETGFKIGMDFVVKKESFTKIMENKYEARQQNQAARK